MRATVSNDFGFKGMHHDDMKLAFKRLIKVHHPDLGGDTATCQLLNAEFAYWYARAATEHVKAEKVAEAQARGKNTEYHENRYTSAFVESLEEMIAWIYSQNIDLMPGISVDVKGVFIWISGIKPEHAEIRNAIKAHGFTGGWKTHDDKTSEYMWKYTPAMRSFGTNHNIDDISRKYGNTNKNRRASNGLTVYR